MRIDFFRCISCGRADEYNRLLARHFCECGGTKIRPTHLSFLEMTWFALNNPSYVWKALRGEEIYDDDSDDTVSNSGESSTKGVSNGSGDGELHSEEGDSD